MIGQVKSAAIQIILLGLYDDFENKKTSLQLQGSTLKAF